MKNHWRWSSVVNSFSYMSSVEVFSMCLRVITIQDRGQNIRLEFCGAWDWISGLLGASHI